MVFVSGEVRFERERLEEMALVAESTRLVRSLSRTLSDEVSTSQGVLKGVNVGGKVRGVRIQSRRRAARDVGIVAALSRGDGELAQSFAVRRSSGLSPANSVGRGFPGARGGGLKAAAVKVEEEVPLFLLEEAFEKDYVPEDGKENGKSSSNSEGKESKKEGKKKDRTGASTVLSGVKLENVSKTYKNVTVLNNVSWEVKRGERVGLVGINGAGKTTQLNIIAGKEEPDSGNVVKARPNMKIAFLSQEFEVVGSRTLREEFMSTFASEMDISARIEKVQVCFASFDFTDSLVFCLCYSVHILALHYFISIKFFFKVDVIRGYKVAHIELVF